MLASLGRQFGYFLKGSRLPRLFLLLFLSGSLSFLVNIKESESQLMGEKAEMDRLEVKAEEAMANGDPNGATLAIGRAALMASVLAQKENHPQTQLVYKSAERLFRAQENTYRAFALFEQAGGQLPAPSGVCQLLSLAKKQGINAANKLDQASAGTNMDSCNLCDRFLKKTQEWIKIVNDLRVEFSCN